MIVQRPTTRIIRHWADFITLERSWDELLARSDANTIFLSWNWINSWYNTSLSTIRPYIVVIEYADEIVAIAPFYIQDYTLAKCIPYRGLKCLADQSIGSEYSNFIVSAALTQYSTAQLKRLLWDELNSSRCSKHWDFIWLSNIAAWTRGGQSLLTALAQQSAFSYNQREIEFAATDLQPFDHDILPQLSKSLRTNIKQTTKYLDKKGHVDIKLTQDIEELPQHLDTLFHLHNLRWQRTGNAGSFSRPALAAFYKSFTPIALNNQQLRLLRLEVDGEIQAMQLGYVYDGQFLALQEGFNPDFIAGTGQVLRHAAFNACLDENLTSYDFLAIYTDHKRRWLAQKNIGCQLFIWQHKYKNLPFNVQPIWPTGRYLNED